MRILMINIFSPHLLLLPGGWSFQHYLSLNNYHSTPNTGIIMNFVEMEVCTSTHPMGIKNEYGMISLIFIRISYNT